MSKINFDISKIRKTFGDDEESLKDLIKTFLKYTPESINQMILSAKQNNFDAIAYIAHKMIPGISFFGLKEIEDKLTNIENLAKNKQSIESLKYEIIEVKEVIENFMKFLKEEFNI